MLCIRVVRSLVHVFGDARSVWRSISDLPVCDWEGSDMKPGDTKRAIEERLLVLGGAAIMFISLLTLMVGGIVECILCLQALS